MTNSEVVLRLSNREFEVFELRKQGLSAKEIAKKIQVSHRTVESHIFNIMNKGGFRNSLELVTFAGKVVINKKFTVKTSEKCKLIEEKLSQGQSDKEIQLSLEINSQTYGMLKRLVLNKPGVKEELDKLNAPKPMFKWLRYA